MTVWWWTCHHFCCLDRMAQTDRVLIAERDRDAHIASRHPGWQPTAAEMRISSWQ